MSEMTEIERIQTAKAAVAQIPGGEIWLEELLIRGRPDGSIAGGHVVYAYRAADAFGGKTPPQVMAPFPVTVGAKEPAFAAIVAEINAATLSTVAVLRDAVDAALSEAASKAAEVEKLTTRIAELEAK